MCPTENFENFFKTTEWFAKTGSVGAIDTISKIIKKNGWTTKCVLNFNQEGTVTVGTLRAIDNSWEFLSK
jgi:hypothetical protein